MCSLEKRSGLCAGRPEPLEFRTAQRSLPRATGPQTEERPHRSIYSEPQQPCISPDSNLTIPGLCRGTGNTWGQGCGLFAITPVSWRALVGWYRQTPCRSRVGRSIWGTCAGGLLVRLSGGFLQMSPLWSFFPCMPGKVILIPTQHTCVFWVPLL